MCVVIFFYKQWQLTYCLFPQIYDNKNLTKSRNGTIPHIWTCIFLRIIGWHFRWSASTYWSTVKHRKCDNSTRLFLLEVHIKFTYSLTPGAPERNWPRRSIRAWWVCQALDKRVTALQCAWWTWPKGELCPLVQQ